MRTTCTRWCTDRYAWQHVQAVHINTSKWWATTTTTLSIFDFMFLVFFSFRAMLVVQKSQQKKKWNENKQNSKTKRIVRQHGSTTSVNISSFENKQLTYCAHSLHHIKLICGWIWVASVWILLSSRRDGHRVCPHQQKVLYKFISYANIAQTAKPK